MPISLGHAEKLAIDSQFRIDSVSQLLEIAQMSDHLVERVFIHRFSRFEVRGQIGGQASHKVGDRREGRRRYPATFAAGWVSRPDDTFAELMRDGTLDLAMVEGYSVCWLHNHCSDTIEGYFSRLEWARSAGFINRTLFAFGWMVPEDATGPFNPPLNATHGLHMPKRCDKIGCDNPNGWTLPKLRASMLRLKAAFPEMPGVLGWGGNRGGCGNASRAFLRGASQLMAELWPSSAEFQRGGALKSDDAEAAAWSRRIDDGEAQALEFSGAGPCPDAVEGLCHIEPLRADP